MTERILAVYSDKVLVHKPRIVDGCENAARVVGIIESSFARGGVKLVEPTTDAFREIALIHNRKMMMALRSASLAANDQPQRTKYCTDKGVDSTPITQGTYDNVMVAAACAREAADQLVNKGHCVTYSISRPPGHHAGFETYGGFCFVNNAMVAAERLMSHKNARVVVLDFDHHHANGTQNIINHTGRGILVSTHGDPRDGSFPGTGLPTDTGSGLGQGHAFNFPFEPGIGVTGYLKTLKAAIKQISDIHPDTIVVSAGFDNHQSDKPPGMSPPTEMSSSAFEDVASGIAKLGVPTTVILEGGYGDHLPDSFDAFFTSLNILAQ